MPNALNYLLLFITILGSGPNKGDGPIHFSHSARAVLSGPLSAGGEMTPERMEAVLRKDTTLFRAFRNLRFAEYRFSNELIFSEGDEDEPGVYHSINKQFYRDSCRSMKIEKELINRNFYDYRHAHRFHTAKLYDSLFFTHQLVCGEPPYLPMIPDDPDKSRLDHYTDQLKILVFRPGMTTDLPFIGNKTAIFGEELRPFYQFELAEEFYRGKPVYAFRAFPKPYLENKQKDKLAIQWLETFVDRQNLQVLFRDYHVKMDHWLFDCDIRMRIDLEAQNGLYYPVKIQYDGYWDILGIDSERGRFEIDFYDFRS